MGSGVGVGVSVSGMGVGVPGSKSGPLSQATTRNNKRMAIITSFFFMGSPPAEGLLGAKCHNSYPLLYNEYSNSDKPEPKKDYPRRPRRSRSFFPAEGLLGRELINREICSILMTRSRTIVKE